MMIFHIIITQAAFVFNINDVNFKQLDYRLTVFLKTVF